MEMLAILGQTFESYDLIIIGLLVLLEGTLSVDNALVLGLLAKRLPPHQRKKALTYGLFGAFAFRMLAIIFAAFLLSWPVVKLVGGGYLIYVAVKHLFFTEKHEDEQVKLDANGHPIFDDEEPANPDTPRELTPEEREAEIAKRNPLPEAADPSKPSAEPAAAPLGKPKQKYAEFWTTVAVIELTDIAFAVDSILAALAFIPRNPTPDSVNPKLWVVILGGCIGLLLMRVAAVMFIKLLEKFPRFEIAAYLLVLVIGLKLAVDYLGNNLWIAQHVFGMNMTPEEASHYHPVNFHSTSSLWFWGFWASMIVCFFVGFSATKKPAADRPPAAS
jgi:YkoY family integral membrane protein